MNVTKDDILEALGIKERMGIDWLGPSLLGFGVGALVGGLVALMLTPRSGAELREDLLERGRRMARRGREVIQETAEEVARQTEPRNY